MITAHIAGMPVEESVLQLLPAGAATVTVLAFGVRGMSFAGEYQLNGALAVV